MKTLDSFDVFSLIKDYVYNRIESSNLDDVICSKPIIVNKCEYAVFVLYSKIYNKVIRLNVYDMQQEPINVTDLSYLVGLIEEYCTNK